MKANYTVIATVYGVKLFFMKVRHKHTYMAGNYQTYRRAVSARNRLKAENPDIEYDIKKRWNYMEPKSGRLRGRLGWAWW